MRRWKQAGVSVGAAAALCMSLGGGLAFGATTLADDGANWEVPTTPMTNTVWKDADGNVVAANTAGATQYKVLTTWAEAWSTSGPDYLGVSNSAYFGNGGNGNAKVETYAAAAKSTTVGVWATAANENPNAYNWNTFYNLYVTDSGDSSLTQSDWGTSSTTTNGGADWSSDAGVWCGFKYRPDVIWTNNNLSANQAKDYIAQIKAGQYSATATSSSKTYEGETRASTLYTPDANEDGTYDSSFAVYGDDSYDPQIISPNNNSPYSFVATAYELADAADKVIEATAGNPGLGEDELDWKTVNKLPRANRYTETPAACALNIERLAKGSVYYTLAKIADGTVEKKKVAYVAYPWSYSQTSQGNTTTYTNETQVVVAVYDYTENIGSGPLDGRASWTPLVVDQLSTDEKYGDKTGGSAVSDMQTSTNATTTYQLYYATADELADCDAIYYSVKGNKTPTEFQEWIEANATSESIAAKAKDIKYLTEYPIVTNGSNFTMEKLIYGTYGMDFLYPELFPSMQLSSYWCDEIYHLTDSSLASAMSWIYSRATLPEGTTLSNIPAQYDMDAVINKFQEGRAYYEENKDSDETIKRVLANTALDGSTTFGNDETSYVFNNFEPTENWAAPDVYTVTFDSDGGSEVATQAILTGNTATKPADPTKEGYTFAEWQLDGAAYDFDAAVTGDITLKATWTQDVEEVAMHRLYNPNSGEHFYTSDDDERDNLKSLGWNDEGEGWTAPSTSGTPVYRLYNENGGEHHYTFDESEKDMLVSVGWKDEGIGWYSDDDHTVPLYREYNPNAFANNHNYTTDKDEHDYLVGIGWNDEGYAWYGI